MKPSGNTILALAFCFLASLTSVTGRSNSQDRPPTVKGEQEQEEAVRLGTALVMVPVTVSDRNDRYIADMRKEEFSIFEDGVQQEIAFFAAVHEPFHVVLMLDTSASTQEKLGLIQRAARAFLQELKPEDRVKVISFDDEVKDHGPFTDDRAELGQAIDSTRPGQGTKLYDAVSAALVSLKKVKGRKSIVLFTDGVDWHSDSATYDQNLHAIQEAGILVYPIRYDTRAETEALVRRQQQENGGVVDLGDILGGKSGGSTPPIAGGKPIPFPKNPAPPLGGSIPPIILTRPPNPQTGNRYPDRYPPVDDRFPPSTGPASNDPRYPRDPRGRTDDSTSVMLESYYRTADQYLNDVASYSGGRLYRADTLGALPLAFSQIADELRNQYSLGYYPANAARDGGYRKIKVKVTRKKAVVRARPGYKALDTAEESGR